MFLTVLSLIFTTKPSLQLYLDVFTSSFSFRRDGRVERVVMRGVGSGIVSQNSQRITKDTVFHKKYNKKANLKKHP